MNYTSSSMAQYGMARVNVCGPRCFAKMPALITIYLNPSLTTEYFVRVPAAVFHSKTMSAITSCHSHNLASSQNKSTCNGQYNGQHITNISPNQYPCVHARCMHDGRAVRWMHGQSLLSVSPNHDLN